VGRYPYFNYFANPLNLYLFAKQKSEAYAGFGEVNYTPTDKITLIAGVRYSHEKRIANGTGYGLSNVVPNPLPAYTTPQITFSSVTPRASIRYTFDSGDNIYFTFSQGFKSGGYSIGAGTPAIPPFRPEKLTAYEVGLKTSTSRMLSANLAAFYYDYTDQQQSTFVFGTARTTNAASSELYGFDADMTLRTDSPFSFRGNVAYLHAKYLQYPNATFNVPRTSAACLCGNVTMIGDLSGRTLPDAPEWTFGLTGRYDQEFSFGTIGLSATLYNTSSYFIETSNRLKQSGYTTLAARAEFEPAGTNLSLYVWGKNLTNSQYIMTAFIGGGGDAVAFSQPATYGIGAKYQF
jgi:iron complex outermembrane receptor protein